MKMLSSTQTVRRLAFTAVAGPLLFWVVVFVLGFVIPGYQFSTEYISMLGAVGAPYAIVQRLNFAVLGISILAFAVGIHLWFDDGRRPRVGTLLLILFGIGAILAGVFPPDPTAPDSLTNVLHELTAFGFLAGILSVGVVTRRLHADERWPTYRYESIMDFAIVLFAWIVFMFSYESAWDGLTQRLYIGALSLWIVLQSVRLYRIVGELRRD